MGRLFMTAALLLIFMASGVSVKGENYLRKGLKWEMVDIFYGTFLGDKGPEYLYHELREEASSDGSMILREYITAGPDYPEYGEKQGKAIKVVGDKVYLVAEDDPAVMVLLYDFSMTPGETAEIVLIPSRFYSASDITTSNMRCIGESICAESPELPMLTLVADRYEDPIDESVIETEWIKGLGNTRGIFAFSDRGLVGIVNRVMTRVTLDGEVLYVASFSNKVDVIRNDSNPGSEKFYDMQGREVRTPDTPGIYIRIKDGKAEKIRI